MLDLAPPRVVVPRGRPTEIVLDDKSLERRQRGLIRVVDLIAIGDQDHVALRPQRIIAGGITAGESLDPLEHLGQQRVGSRAVDRS